MEGYTNVIGSSYDFDDLDIEGRVVDEWNAEDEDKHVSKTEPSKNNLDERTILNERVKLDNGQQADVFSVVRKNNNVWYTCHLCTDTVEGLAALRQHVVTGKHKVNMCKPVHPCAKFIKLDPKENLSLEPGEPVPPGLEEVIFKQALIQPKLDAYKAHPLIGLEFMVELTESTLDTSEVYYCLLCDKTGSERNMFIHFTSIYHYMKYMSMYFPTCARKLQALPNKKMKKAFGLLVTDIIKDIEDKYGRLKPQTVTYSDFHFQGRKAELHKAVYEGPHFRELDGEYFDEKVTAENVVKKNKEVIAAPPVNESLVKSEFVKIDETVEGSGISFNKNSRINVDKKQLRTRDEDKRNSSPDVEIVNVTKPKSPGKKRGRSRSLSSISSASSSSSRSRRSRLRSSSRHHSKPLNYRNWSRSRSRSPGQRYRRYERRSPSYGRRHSPGRRSRSPRRHFHHRARPDSRGRSPEPFRFRVDRYGRQVKEHYDSRTDRYRRDKTPEERIVEHRPVSVEEKVRWEKFREELKKVETVKLEKLKYHEKNPEKHPQYPEEWKAFWNRRYNELQRSGIDPSKHDFKPEWIAFWTKRMKELYEEDLGKAKDELKKKFDLPEDPGAHNAMPWKYHQRKRSPGLVDISPPTPDKKDVIADIKTTWKAFTGSDIKDNPKRPLSPWEEDMPTTKRRQSPKSTRSESPPLNANDKLLEDMPQRKSRTSALIFVLRKLTVLEQELGSLAPKVFELMSQSLALEKIKEEASLDLLLEEENSVYLETVREKLIALLCAGVVPRNLVNTARSAIKNIDIALYLAFKKQRSLPVETVRSVMGGGVIPPTQSCALNTPTVFPPVHPLPKSEPLIVPGVGQVDKVAIAQQIATALVEQGKSNVTEAELEQLINAVVGMAEASAHTSQPMTTAYFLQQLQSVQNPTVPTVPTAIPPAPAVPPMPVVHPQPAPAAPLLSQPPVQTKPVSVNPEPQPSVAFGALKLLQSAYDETSKAEQDSPKPDVVETVSSNTVISDTELASTLSVFNKMTKEDQPSFVKRLKTTNPEMYKRLCPFIPSSVIAAADNPSQSPNSGSAKRSPINIPISKERSEQKIKSLSSGRLSPFSQRSSGGANPTVGEKVVIVDDDDDKSDVKIVSETPAKPRANFDLSKYKSNESDLDDEDDDDYSFEDVYKAAQEKLRQQQKQIDVDNSNSSAASKETVNTDSKEASKFITDNSQQKMPQNNQTWGNLGDSANPAFNMVDKPQQQNQVNDNFKLQPGMPEPNFRAQQLPYSDSNKYNEVAPKPPVPGANQSSYPYQGSMPERQQPINPYNNSQPPLGGSMIPTYGKDQYPSDPYYNKGNADYYNKNSQYPPDASYSSGREPYGNSYPSDYRDSYNTPSYNAQGVPPYGNQTASGNSGYGNPMSSYGGNQYDARDAPQYGGHNVPQARYPQTPNPPAYPIPPAPPSRYPSQRYPPY